MRVLRSWARLGADQDPSSAAENRYSARRGAVEASLAQTEARAGLGAATIFVSPASGNRSGDASSSDRWPGAGESSATVVRACVVAPQRRAIRTERTRIRV